MSINSLFMLLYFEIIGYSNQSNCNRWVLPKDYPAIHEEGRESLNDGVEWKDEVMTYQEIGKGIGTVKSMV